jgi:sugar lactone lactonase YvrE
MTSSFARVAVALAALALAGPAAADGTVTTVAGGGDYGDGGPIAQASIAQPNDLAFDAEGNLYFTDTAYSVIRRVDARTGVVTRVVGTGIRGFAGDGGPAESAEAWSPFGLALDADGNIYFCDFENFRVRFVNRQDHAVSACGVTAAPGAIVTIAGTGENGTADAFDTPTGFCVDVVHLGDGGPATESTLAYPRGIALRARTDGGPPDAYFDDIDNQRVRRIDGVTGIITTVAGMGCADFMTVGAGDGGPATAAPIFAPTSVAFDGAGNLFFGEGHGRIRRVDATTGAITTIAGASSGPNGGYGGDGGPAAAAFLVGPNNLTFDAAGNLFFADQANNRIRRIAARADGTVGPDSIITTVAGSGFADLFGQGRYSAAQSGGPPQGVDLFGPSGLAFLGAKLFLGEDGDGMLRVLDPGSCGVVDGGADETLTDLAGTAGVKNPTSVAGDRAGSVYFSQNFDSWIRRASPGGAIEDLVGTGVPAFSLDGVHPDPGDGGLVSAATVGEVGDVRFDDAGDLYFVDFYVDLGTSRLRRIDSGSAASIGPASRIETVANVDFPTLALALGATYAYLGDPLGNRVWRVRLRDGALEPFVGTGVPTPGLDPNNPCVTGTRSARGDGGAALDATLAFPLGIGLDASERHLYICDAGNRSVRVVDLQHGTIDTLFEFTSDACEIAGALVAIGDDAVFVIEQDGSGDSGFLVGEIDVRADAPQATTVAGDGFTFFAGFTGDGPALAAELDGTSGIGVDSERRVLIPEWIGQRVRRLDQGLPPGLGAASRAAAARPAWPHAGALRRGGGRRFGR